MLNFSTDENGRYFPIETNKIKRNFNLFVWNGKPKRFLKKCSLCKFAYSESWDLEASEIDDTNDFLHCTHKFVENPLFKVGVKDNGYCPLFDISKETMEDLYNEC